MRKLVLKANESLELQKFGAVVIVRNGFDILIEKATEREKRYFNRDYNITVFCAYDEVVLTQTKEIRENEK